MSTNFLFLKVCWQQGAHYELTYNGWQCPAFIWPLHLHQTFSPIIWVFTKVEGDGIKSRLTFKIFSTLTPFYSNTWQNNHGLPTSHTIPCHRIIVCLRQWSKRKIGTIIFFLKIWFWLLHFPDLADLEERFSGRAWKR